MKNRAFTLIELLAVIVILAIIALIVVPIVLNIINDSKKSADERSIELYGKAVENAILNYQLKNMDDTEITFEKIKSYVKYNGNEIICGDTIINNNGSVYLNNCSLDGTKIEYTYGSLEQEQPKTIKFYLDSVEYTANEGESFYEWSIRNHGVFDTASAALHTVKCPEADVIDSSRNIVGTVNKILAGEHYKTDGPC